MAATNMRLIAKNVLGSDTASVAFSDIPGTYTDLLLVVSARSSRASNTYEEMRIRLNGTSSDSNFTNRYLTGNGSTAASGTITTYGYAGDLPASSVTANTFGTTEIYFPNYAGSANKSFSLTTVQENNSATAGNAYIDISAGLWSSIAAITQIYLFCANSTNFVTGSSFFLYGITKA